MDLISVIIPVYNVQKYLTRCVESVRNQTYKNLEIILVDDESPDECPRMCDEYCMTDHRIKVVHKKNGGLGFARNSGLEVTSGEYVTFIDSDDWISPSHIENLHTEAVKTQADVVIGGHTSVLANGTMILRPNELDSGLYEGERIRSEILLPLIGADVDFPRDVQINSSSCMNLYKTWILREHSIRFISEKFAVAEDLYFNVDFFFHARRIAVTDELGYYYFENAGSISRKYDPKRFERTINFYKTIRQQVEKYGLSGESRHRLERSYFLKIRVAVRHIVGSELKFSQKIRQIRGILDHEITREVLGAYPVDTMIPAMRTLAKLMRRGDAYGVYCLMGFREAARKSDWAKALLRKVGIGK